MENLLAKCNKGDHDLRVIYRGISDPISNAVVRWCRICGAVVVDEDYDNRTSPGAIMRMQFPTLAQKK